ncbi:MAG: metalloregulator ArsR/SmtB family transcription factor [Peptococcaceae bacterium]|nr:metalloregulator ArsR/SmtB family transcription factor [Peptococcaceae bacterium]
MNGGSLIGKRDVRELCGYFSALSDVTRMRIISLLTDHEMCVCELVDRLGMSQPAVSHHLGILRKAGLISNRKKGKWMYYSIIGHKMVENHNRYKELVLSIVEERVNKGVPASPAQNDEMSYCKLRGKLLPAGAQKNLNALHDNE